MLKQCFTISSSASKKRVFFRIVYTTRYCTGRQFQENGRFLVLIFRPYTLIANAYLRRSQHVPLSARTVGLLCPVGGSKATYPSWILCLDCMLAGEPNIPHFCHMHWKRDAMSHVKSQRWLVHIYRER
jgi:hypothetical protein